MSENLIGVTEKMNLKEFGNNLIEMCKDLRYIGDQIRKRLKIPLNAYAESARTKSDTEDLCQIVGNVLEAARLNIDGGIETLREGIRNTEHNAVLKEVYTKFDKYLDCHNVDRNDNIKSTDVEHAPNMQSCNTAPNNSDKSTSNEEFVYDDQLEREIKEEKAKSTTADQLEDVLQSSTETEQSSTETEQSSTITNAQENRNKRTAERISHDDPIGKVHPKKRATRNEECSQKIDIEQPSDDPNCETVEEPNHEVQDLPDHLKPEISEDIELPPPGDTNLETVEAPNHNVEDLADHLKPEISEDTLEDLEDIEVNGLSNNNRNKKKSNSNSAETILDLPSSPKAESFCIDIEEHDLTEYKKVESLDTIIASPPILDSLPRPESPSNKSVFDESTIPDNSPLSQDLGSEDFMANSDTGRQSQYNSESENDDVSNSESDDTFRISKTPINKIPRKTSKLNKSKTDQPATNEDIFEEITCDVDTNKNTSENKSKQDSGSAPEELSNKTIEADTCNLDTNKNTSENRDRDPVVEQLPNEVVKESTCDVDTNKNTSENKSEQDKNFDEISNEIVEGNICDVDNRDSVVEERSNTILEKNDEPYIEGKDPPSNTSEPGISSELDQDLHILHEKPNEEDNVNDLPDIPTDQPWSIELTKEKVDKDVNKQLKVNGNNLDVTPDNVLQVLNGSELSHGNADTAKRKVFEDDQGITADHTFISEGYENECEDNSKEDNTNRLSNDTEEADKESVCSFTFDIQEDYEHMVLATQIDTCPSDEDTCETLCGSYSSEGTIIDEPLDTPNINDINACESDGIRLARSKPARKLSSDVDPLDSIDVIGGDSDIVSRKRPRKLSTESESNGDDSDAQSETSIQIKKSTKKLESDLSDDENCNNVDVSQNEHPISSDKNNPTDVQSERSIQIKKSSRKLDSDVSDSESNHKEPKGSELNDNSKNCTPASVNDFENTVGLSHISRSTNSDNEKNENVPKVSIEDSIISDCESNSGSSVAGDHNIIDDIYSSEDDAFIEVSPHKVLNEGAESTNDETKDIAIKEETKTDDDNTIKEPSNKDSLNELLDEYFNAKEQIKSAQNTVSDNKVDEPPVTLDNDSLSIKCSQVIPEEKVEIDCEKNKDDLLTLLDQYSKDIESEMNKTNLLELLEEREKSSNGNDEYEFKLPDSELLYDVATVASVKDELPLEMSSQIEAEKIFQKLLVDDSDISDISDSEDDSSSINIEETDLGSDSSTEDLFDEYKDMYGLKKLSVYIERLKLDKDMLEDAKLNIGENNEADSDIDRLCNIGNVLNKRKGDSSSKKSPRRKRRKKSGTSSWSGSSSSSSINDSDTDSDVMESLGVRRLSCTSAPLPEDEDELLADALCEKMSGDSSDVGSGASDDEKTGKKDKKSQDNDSKIKKEPLSKEELEKRSWRKDALLHSNVDTDSDNNDKRSANKAKINERITRRFKKFKAKRNLSSDTDSDVTNVQSQDVRNLQRNKNKPKNKKSSATDTDSEIEFVISPRTPSKWSPTKSVINISEDEAFETTPTKGKGRRNIRALVSDENLAESTQRAQAEENERIARLEERRKFSQILSQSFGSQLEPEEGDCLVLDLDKENLKPLIKVHSQITKKLKPHQKEGVQFMWESCYESVEQLKKGSLGSGCILAHCMGLGKTLQALALIHTIFSYDDITKTKHVLVVCPLSTVPNWKNEYNLAYGKIKDCKIPLYLISSDKTSSRKYETVRRWYRNGGMLVLGYEAFGNMTDDAKLDKHSPLFKEDILAALVDPGPDLVICDEGHLLRNKSSRRTLSLNKIKAKRRIVLTGTPLQNNLLEYYHMVNFVKPNLLGTEREYKTNFVNPITNGQYEDSTAGDIRLMKFRTHILHRKLKKTVQRVEDTELKLYLPKLVDYGVFIQLHKVQVDFYKTYLDLALTRVDKNRKTFLSDVQILKYIGSHPYVLRAAMQYKNKKIKEEDVIDDNDKVDESLISNEGWWKSLMPKDVSDVLDYGNKFSVVMSLIEECERAGDKMLIFSQNYAEMDSLEHFLKIMNPSKWRKKTDYYRMDGTVPAEDRTDMCDKFNDKRNKKLRLFIMSTKVGGLGLNLTGANRVIIMNVNWNPSYDTQSVFRTFRFGQDKEVFVYRLISMDTMEEKIYQRQVTKLAIAHRVVDKHQITRHYNSTDIMELYSVEPNADEERPLPNLPEDKVLAKVLQKHNFVFRWHEHQQLLANHPEEDLNEAEKNAAWEEFNRKANEPPITIFPQIPFTQNLPGMQRAGFVMASMLANNPNMTVPGNSTFIPGMIASSSSVVNINDVINQTRMKMNNAKGLESPSSEDHDYCLPNAAVASRTQWNTSSVSAKPPAATVSTQPAANKPKTPVRKLIFNPDNNTVLPNPLSNLHRNITKLINKTPVPGTPSVLYSTSQGVVTISHTTTSGITATSTTPSISTIARPNVSSAAAVTPKVTQLPNAPNMTLINTPTIPSAHRASSNAIYYPRAMTSATVQPNYSGLPSTRPKPTAVNRSNVNNKRPGPNKVNINPAALPNYGVISATTARNSKPTTGLNTISTVKRDQGKPTIAVNTNNLNNKTHVPNKVNALPPPPLVMYHNPTSELNRLPLPLSYSKPSSELNKLPTPLSNTKPSSEPNKLRSPLSNSKPNSKRKKLPHPLSNSKPTDLNRLPPLVYPNPNNLTSDVSKSNMEKDPLFIHPKLVGATPHIDKPYKEAVLLIEKLNARKTANEKQVNGALVPKGLPTQKSLALTKFQIHPGASVSDIRRQTSNTSPKTIPARTIGLKANSAPTSTSIKKLPSGVELTKLHELTKKRSNKENKKVPRSLINLADDDVTVIAPGSNEMIPNISRMKEISINKVNKKPKNVIRLD